MAALLVLVATSAVALAGNPVPAATPAASPARGGGATPFGPANGKISNVPGVYAARVCPVSTSRTHAECLSWVRTDASGTLFSSPLASPMTLPSGFGPTEFHAVYGLPTTSGAAQTIAIVDAFANPNVFADLTTYDTTFGLPAFPLCVDGSSTSCLAILNQSGATSPLPASDDGWGVEINLDVQAAHAMCQNCRINLYETDSNSNANLATGVNTAVSQGATIVSNSYGSFLNDCSANPAYDHPNVAILVSAGDSGFGVACPAVHNTVISVGGTALFMSGGAYSSEAAWTGTGSGCSANTAAQAWQTAASNWAAIGCGTGRGMNDVAALADPGTGAAIVDSFGGHGWIVVGGTSLASPLMAGVYGLAGSAASYPYPAESVYRSPVSLHHVTSGSNGSCPSNPLQCTGGVGYDLPTGIGTPNGFGGFAPANDNFANAKSISGTSGSIDGANPAASAESGEPVVCPAADCGDTFDQGPFHTAWYSWTAPSNGTATFDTCSANTNYDTTMAVYTGSAFR